MSPLKRASTPWHAAAGGALALSLLVLSVPRISAQPADAKPIDDPESYAVYSALLPDRAMQGMRRTMIVIQTEAITDPHGCWPSGPPIETEWKSTLESLRAENAHARAILSGLQLSVPYIVLPTADILAFFHPPALDGWKHFYERYPDSAGFIAVSAVGFDTDQAKAIVYFAHHYEYLGGDYSYRLLRKAEGKWQDSQVPGVKVCWMAS
jgi:hypothetical protein